MNFLEIIGWAEWNKEKADACWQALVMLKRDLDQHVTKPDFYEFPKSTWHELVKRIEKYQPHS